MQKLAEICVRRPVFATMLILSITVVGTFSFRALGVDLFPKIDLPTITVTVINPGASPEEVETEITDKVEGAVNTISGIDELRSTSLEGVSQVFITFVLEKNADVAAQEVRNKIDLIVNDLPETAEVPIVQKLDTDATPVLRLAVSAPRSLREVTDIADKKIKRMIESINGVGNVEIVGGRTREIEVWVVSKQSGQNTVAVADAVKERLDELRTTLPRDVKTQIVGDQTIFIKAALHSIQLHLIEGSILAAIVVFVFLWSFRSTFIAAIAIPTSIIATFGLMNAMGFTLNQITMLALTLMVGIVIDDAIVVLENIYRFIEEKGVPPFQAAIDGTKEIGLAVTATTLSLLAVFLPVGFMGGIVGRFMSSFGLTSAFAIAVSLLVSFTLTPMLAARLIKRSDDAEEGLFERHTEPADHGSKQSRFYRPIDNTYKRLLSWSMTHRWVIVVACAI